MLYGRGERPEDDGQQYPVLKSIKTLIRCQRGLTADQVSILEANLGSKVQPSYANNTVIALLITAEVVLNLSLTESVAACL